jgi:glycosyltransferase involved in cell wall biosynthesis
MNFGRENTGSEFGLRASIVINNYNYARYLRSAIDSALGQTYEHLEVIVVDDGSSDDSRSVIAEYGDRIRAILKGNGGQTSAMNAGFAACRGDIVVFLDADDVLLSKAVANAVASFEDHEVVKVHWPSWVITKSGQRTGALKPPRSPPRGDLLNVIVREGPDSPCWSPTSGNAWHRRFLERVFPLPEIERQHALGSASADAHLSMLAPLFGRVETVREPQGHYRLHGSNGHSAMRSDLKLSRDLELFEYRAGILERWCHEAGVEVHRERWRQSSWLWRTKRAKDEIDAAIPSGASFVLVDDNALDIRHDLDRSAIPFLERNGEYWGSPPDDSSAIHELERLRREGVGFVVVGWPSFWWLEHYPGFHQHLIHRTRPVLSNERLLVFDMRDPSFEAAGSRARSEEVSP